MAAAGGAGASTVARSSIASVADIHMDRVGPNVPICSRNAWSCRDVGSAGPISWTSSKTHWMSLLTKPKSMGQDPAPIAYPRFKARESSMSMVPTSTAG